ncbi:MAG: undecaprenyl-diphosphate phosphatase [Clostridia bacterium]|nr:undecaprenyl-diphosphate phosphatase [Clostridia bacterium]
MNLWQSIALGIVQGLTEFLPISSSGHLILFQRLFNVDLEGNDLFFDVILHLGTLVAVCTIFYKDILKLFKRPFKQLFYLCVSTLPAALIGVLLGDWLDDVFYGGKYLWLCFIFTAILLIAAQLYSKYRKKTLPLNFKISTTMGLAQAVAVLPGISRSGATITAGVFAGGKREEVAKFSFLLSVPIILGSFVFSILKGVTGGWGAFTVSANFGFNAVVGFVAAALSGLFAIKVMLKVIKNANYKWFAIYLIILSIICIFV